MIRTEAVAEIPLRLYPFRRRRHPDTAERIPACVHDGVVVLRGARDASRHRLGRLLRHRGRTRAGERARPGLRGRGEAVRAVDGWLAGCRAVGARPLCMGMGMGMGMGRAWAVGHVALLSPPPPPSPPSLGSPPPGSRGRGAAAALAGQGSTGRRDQLRACATCVCVGYAGRWAWRRISACTPTTSSRRRSWRRTFRRQRMSRPSREKTARVH
jgi:hypothetical protein